MLKKGLFILILLNLIFIQAQYSKKEIEKIFKKSILQPKKSKINIGENSWKICIDNSKNEINLYEGKFENYTDCCRYTNWTFYRKNKFIKSESHPCSEPPLSSVTTLDDWYEIEFKDSQSLILIIKSKTITEEFIVKEIQKRKDNLHIIKLVKH
jgi:hypothetical protein